MGTERAHKDKIPTGSCRSGKIGGQKEAEAESLIRLSLSKRGLAALFYLIFLCILSKHLCCKVNLSAPVANRSKWSLSKEEAFTSGFSSLPSSE